MENNPQFVNLTPIVDSGLGKNYFLFFNEVNLKKNLQALKRMPHFVLLGNFSSLINSRKKILIVEILKGENYQIFDNF